MAVVSNDYDVPVIRPLLDVTKEELLAYLADRKLTYCIDSTMMIFNTSEIKFVIALYLS